MAAGAAKQIENVVERLAPLISTICIEGVNRLEDGCSWVRAVVADLEIQNLHLPDSAEPMLLDLLKHLRATYEALLRAHAAEEVRSSLSCWDRLALDQTWLRRIKRLNRAIENTRNGEAWKHMETCVLKSIKRVNDRATGTTTTHPAGRESVKNSIVELLLSPSSKSVKYVPVVSMFGERGIGKSKLAKSVFNTTDIVDEFDPFRFWVSVGVEFDIKNVVVKIIECLVGSRTEDFEADTLKDLLEKLIFEKKFLLVLDDFSNEEKDKWDELMQCLEGGAEGSRIIVVTSNKTVADRISSLKKFVIKGLHVKDSMALWDNLDTPDGVESVEFEKVKKMILIKCGKNPTSVEVIGKVLRHRPLGTELLPFMRQVLEKLDGSDTCALKLGYIYLPPQLQKCFLYCGLFPRGEDIDAQKLIHHWMAQQYIIRPEGAVESLEEIGLDYFNYLVQRSFVIEGERDELGNIKACKLDDAMHDLATTLAASSGHRVVREPKEKDKMEAFDDIKTRHVSFPFHFNSKLTEKCCFVAQRLRTFLLPKQDIMKSNEGPSRDSFSRDMLARSKHLYVCDLHSAGIAKVPSCIQNLQFLRYLNISDNDEIKFLPNAITKLRCLQVLNVSGCEMLEELPKNIRKLVNLLHLYCHRCWNLKYMPSGIGELTELRTLSWFVVAEDSSLFVHIGGLEELEGLINLREVEIRNLKHLRGGKSECERAKLSDKKHLQSLTLRWNHDEDDKDDAVVDVVEFDVDLQLNENLKRLKVRDYKGVTFPVAFSRLKNLVHISIKNGGRCVSLPPLDHIETLECLSIANFPCLVYIDYNTRSSNVDLFKSLKQLRLLNCPNLKGWSKNENGLAVLGIECFKSVSSAEITDCPKFKPEFPRVQGKPTKENARKIRPLLFTHRKLEHKRQLVKRALAIYRDMHPGDAKTPRKWKTSVMIEDVESFSEELLKNMSCFQKLHISNCPKLLSLPEGLKNCTSLQELEITGCPELEARCRNEDGADWPIVDHIPYIQINGEYIKWDGRIEDPILAPIGRRRIIKVRP